MDTLENISILVENPDQQMDMRSIFQQALETPIEPEFIKEKGDDLVDIFDENDVTAVEFESVDEPEWVHYGPEYDFPNPGTLLKADKVAEPARNTLQKIAKELGKRFDNHKGRPHSDNNHPTDDRDYLAYQTWKPSEYYLQKRSGKKRNNYNSTKGVHRNDQKPVYLSNQEKKKLRIERNSALYRRPEPEVELTEFANNDKVRRPTMYAYKQPQGDVQGIYSNGNYKKEKYFGSRGNR